MSTLSTEGAVTGYPTASIVPFALDGEGRPFVFIAGIALLVLGPDGTPPAVPRGLVERLIVVQYVLPLRVNKAADGGCPYGQYNLGVCCYNGSGTPKNTAAARRWYRKVRPLIL